MPPEEQPLPLDTKPAAQVGLRPLSTDGTGQPEIAKALPAASDLDDVVTEYLAETEGKPPEEKPAVIEAVEPKPAVEEKPVVEAEKKDGEPPAPVVEGETPPAPVVAEKPVVEEKPAEPPAPKTWAADEKIVIGAGPDGTPVEWTRGQLVEALKDRNEIKPLAEEAKSFKEVFGMPASEAKEVWAPILQRLNDEPALQSFVETVFQSDDAGIVQYLSQCAYHYAAQVAAGAVAPVPRAQPEAKPDLRSKLNPEERAEFDRMKSWREKAEMSAAVERVNNEFAEAFRRYPFLATDRALVEELKMTASMLWETDARAGISEDKRRGIPDAVRAKASIYDAMLTARAAAETPPAPPVTATVLGTPGPAPAGTVRPTNGKPKIYPDLSDAVADHLREFPE